MITWKINGYIVYLDDQDKDIMNMPGWYIQKEENSNSRTNYVKHDKYGRLHRYLLGVTDNNIIIDHIDRNGLNNQRKNLRIVSCSKNKRNADTYEKNKFHFNGISFEKAKGQRAWRIKVSYSNNIYNEQEKRYSQKTKSFGPTHGDNFNECLRKAVLFRIQKMKEFDYIIDERSETIEKECLKDNANMEEILGISFKDFEVE